MLLSPLPLQKLWFCILLWRIISQENTNTIAVPIVCIWKLSFIIRQAVICPGVSSKFISGCTHFCHLSFYLSSPNFLGVFHPLPSYFKCHTLKQHKHVSCSAFWTHASHHFISSSCLQPFHLLFMPSNILSPLPNSTANSVDSCPSGDLHIRYPPSNSKTSSWKESLKSPKATFTPCIRFPCFRATEIWFIHIYFDACCIIFAVDLHTVSNALNAAAATAAVESILELVTQSSHSYWCCSVNYSYGVLHMK